MSEPLVIGLVAGESSGDTLGAALLEALRAHVGELRAFGIAGPRMRAAGCEVWADSHTLAVMGLIEPLAHLPQLFALRRRLVREFARTRPHVFVGIDAPAFNLGLEAQLRRQGIATVQYVSPQVWAWRQGRVSSIKRACDLVLCLFPFETEFYKTHGVRAEFVGHPLADQIALQTDRAAARAALGLPDTATVIALLPGSRLGEVRRLGEDFLRAALWLHAQRPDVTFIAPMASPGVRQVFAAHRARVAPDLAVQLFDGQAQPSLIAADAVLVASGTATLETLLVRRPMVAAYRFSALTAWLLRGLGMVKVRHFSQPNLLTGQALVPEFLQEAVNGPDLGKALLQQLTDVPGRERLEAQFLKVHLQLRIGAADRAAQAILRLIEERRMPALERLIAGVDEAGRGPLAGPVVAAAVILDPRRRINGLKDSKQLTPERREMLAVQIRRRALCWAVGWAECHEIDSLNILEATHLAMRRALLGLAVRPRSVLVDGNRLPRLLDLAPGCLTRAIIKGDCSEPAISAASILAKTQRDAIMKRLDVVYPGYGMAVHKGYGTADHLAALVRLAACAIHRRSFGPVSAPRESVPVEFDE